LTNNFKPEIEKKFLVKKLPVDINKYQHHEILQGYISEPDDSITVRLRKYGDKYFKTLKKKGLESRLENETEISQKDFETDWHLTADKRIRKIRYIIPYDKYLIELDIFKDNLEGLILAEVEFSSIKECNSFTPPDWFGDDVTSDPKFSNSYLAKFGLSE
jgi:CYTH domain-containing protein